MENLLNIAGKIKLSLNEIKTKVEKSTRDFTVLQNKNEELKKECSLALERVDACLEKIEKMENNGHDTN